MKKTKLLLKPKQYRSVVMSSYMFIGRKCENKQYPVLVNYNLGKWTGLFKNCDQCELMFQKKTELKDHNWKINSLAKVALMEKENSELKVKLTSSLPSLKRQESEDRKVCNWKINKQKHLLCRITHQRHNYFRSKSYEFSFAVQFRMILFRTEDPIVQ